MNKRGFDVFWNTYLKNEYDSILRLSKNIKANYANSNLVRDRVHEILQEKRTALERIMTIHSDAHAQKSGEGKIVINRHKFSALICHSILESRPFETIVDKAKSFYPELDIITLLPNEYYSSKCFFTCIKVYQDVEKMKSNQSIDTVLKIRYPQTKDNIPYEISFIRNLYWDNAKDVSITNWSNLALANIAYFFDSNNLIV